MKNSLIALSLLLGLVVTPLYAANYTVPSGFTLTSSSYGARLYEKGGTSLVVVDMDKSKISFNGIKTVLVYLGLFSLNNYF